MQPARTAPDPGSVAEAARLLAGAEHPLVIAQRGAGDDASFSAFADWVRDWGIAVCSWWATHLALDTDHPAHVGADPGPWLAEADIVVVLDCLAPWWPDRHALRPGARVISIGPDPLFGRYPTRTFPSDVTLAGEAALALPALIAAMRDRPRDAPAIDARRQRLSDAATTAGSGPTSQEAARNARGISRAWVSLCLSEALEGSESTVFSELGTSLGTLQRRGRASWFQEPHSGGLGWSFPAAMGAKLAAPERTIVATMGDGSYIFANPTACHRIAEALGLGIVVIVLNNAEWGAVRASVAGLYPDGHAVRANAMPLTSLAPVPDFAMTAEASRAWATRVTRPEALRPAIAEAIGVAATGRLALLDVATLPDQ